MSQKCGQLANALFWSLLLILIASKETLGKGTPPKVFQGCLSNKICLIPEKYSENDANCIERMDCKHLIAWRVNEKTPDEVTFEIYSETLGWFALALSADDKIGGDYVMSCHHATDSGNVVIQESWNNENGLGNLNLKTDKRQINRNTTATELFADHKIVYCKFNLKMKFPIVSPYDSKTTNFDLAATEYCPIVLWKIPKNITIGPRDDDPKLNIPDWKNYNNTFPCAKKILVGQRLEPTEEQVTLLKYHGICMIIGWIFCITMGSFLGCFYTDYFTKKFLCYPGWLWIHFLFVMLGIFPMIIGTIFQIQGQSGWESVHGRKEFHRYGGYLAEALYVVGICTGFHVGRERQKTMLRRSFFMNRIAVVEFLHKVSTHLSLLLAVIVIAETPKIPFSSMSCALGYTAIFWILFYALIMIFMSYHRFWATYGYVLKSPSDEMIQTDIQTDLISLGSQKEENEPEIRKTALFVFGAMIVVCTVALAAIVYWPPVEACFIEEAPDRVLRVYRMSQEMVVRFGNFSSDEVPVETLPTELPSPG